MPKKGRKLVGVSWQWCGQLGKTDNYQVGVYSILCHGEYVVPIGFRLFLYRNAGSMQKCRYSRRVIEFQSKPEHAVQLVIEVRGKRADFEWVSTDAVYGNTPGGYQACM